MEEQIAQLIDPLSLAYKSIMGILQQVSEETANNEVEEALEEIELRIEAKFQELKNTFSCNN